MNHIFICLVSRLQYYMECGQIVHVLKHGDRLQWDTYVPGGNWVRIELATGTRLNTTLSYLSRSVHYVFNNKDDGKVLWMGIPDQKTRHMARFFRGRKDFALDRIAPHVVKSVLATLQETPWLFAFEWANPCPALVPTVSLDAMLVWLAYERADFAMADYEALKRADRLLTPKFMENKDMYLPATPTNKKELALLNAWKDLELTVVVDGRLHARRDWECIQDIRALERACRGRPCQARPIGLPLLESAEFTFDEDQKAAIAGAQSLDLRCIAITGPAGSGKTTVAKEIQRQFPEGTILFTAFTGQAAQNLSKVVGNAVTIHSRTYRHKYMPTLEAKAKFKTIPDPIVRVVVIDEMSFVDMHLYRDLLETLPHLERIIWLGQDEQMKPIRRGNMFSAIMRARVPPLSENAVLTPAARRQKEQENGVFRLRTNHRVHAEAVQLLANCERILAKHPLLIASRTAPGPSPRYHGIKEPHTPRHPCRIVRRCSPGFIEDVKAFMALPDHTDANCQLLAHTRATVDKINYEWVRREPYDPADNRPIPMRVGHKIIFKENVYAATVNEPAVQAYEQSNTVMNGTIDFISKIVDYDPTIGTLIAVETLDAPRQMRFQRWIHTEGGLNVCIDNKKFYPRYSIRHAYAVTILSFQGSQADYVGIFMDPNTHRTTTYFDQSEFYVAYTRARKSVTIYCEEFDMKEDALRYVIRENPPLIGLDCLSEYLEL